MTKSKKVVHFYVIRAFVSDIDVLQEGKLNIYFILKYLI